MTTVDFSCVSSLCVFSTKSSIKGSSFLLSLDMVLNIPARDLLLLVSTSIADRLYSLTEEVQHLTCQSSHMCTQFTPSHHPDPCLSAPLQYTGGSPQCNACCSWYILYTEIELNPNAIKFNVPDEIIWSRYFSSQYKY